MGWRGTVRSVSAAMRAAERDAQRRHKQQQREDQYAYSTAAVEDWQLFIRDVTSVHANHANSIDWYEIAENPEPSDFNPTFRRAETVQKELNEFWPTKLDFLRGGTEKRRSRLSDRLNIANAEDEAENKSRAEAVAVAKAEWASDQALAQRILNKEPEGLRDVISEYQSFSNIDLVGSSITFTINDEFLHAVVNVHDDGLIPKVRKKQLASGRLSESKMPDGEFNEIYQDYVCSVAIRVAADLFAILPIAECHVTCRSEMLNSRTGHLENAPILSAFFVKETLSKLNLKNIDPSDSLVNFVHEMQFKRSNGFARIEPLKPLGE